LESIRARRISTVDSSCEKDGLYSRHPTLEADNMDIKNSSYEWADERPPELRSKYEITKHQDLEAQIIFQEKNLNLKDSNLHSGLCENYSQNYNTMSRSPSEYFDPQSNIKSGVLDLYSPDIKQFEVQNTKDEIRDNFYLLPNKFHEKNFEISQEGTSRLIYDESENYFTIKEQDVSKFFSAEKKKQLVPVSSTPKKLEIDTS
jgi:hypothetical protein